jgi:hypothetical protein
METSSTLPLTFTFRDGVFDDGCVYFMLSLDVQVRPVISISLFSFRRVWIGLRAYHFHSRRCLHNFIPPSQFFPELLNNIVVFC